MVEQRHLHQQRVCRRLRHRQCKRKCHVKPRSAEFDRDRKIQPPGECQRAETDYKTLVLIILAAESSNDTDGDGIMDNLDEYPTDPIGAFNSYYPNQVDYSTFAFEDLWPAYGDYDCYDLALKITYQIVTNAGNNVVDLNLSGDRNTTNIYNPQ